MLGWRGLILHINLTDKTYWIERPELSVYQTWLGGRGLAGFYLTPYVTLPYDNPAMPLILTTGPLVGTAAPCSGRLCVMSRSPLTETIADSTVGGGLGVQIKKAGFDGIVITGRSATLCGVEINNNAVEFKDATRLSGFHTSALVAPLSDKGAVASIGPAGENGVLFANIMVDFGYATGRGGLGIVWGAKNLKYLTVQGSNPIEIHDSYKLDTARQDICRLISASPVLLGEYGIAHYGTAAFYDLTHSRRMMPTANFRKTHFEPAQFMNAHAYRQHDSPERVGCDGCHILCQGISQDGGRLPEFDVMSHFSALLENNDTEIVAQANAMCHDLGMDAISAAATLACHSEIQGQRLKGEEILRLLKSIGLGRQEGRALGRGAYRYAAEHGKPELSMTVKKLELPAFDPRGAYGLALAYATSTVGASYEKAYPISHEILRKPVATDRFAFAGKARMIKIAEDLIALFDSLVVCKWVYLASPFEDYIKAFTAVTGERLTAHEALKIGERIDYHERIMNARNGFSSKDDDLPPRFFHEFGSVDSFLSIRPLNREEFINALTNYYLIRGLDETGIPKIDKASALGLQWNPYK
jgi:aldehyde:ferredoxin oxidoreductase